MEKMLTNRRQFAKLLKRTKIADETIELRFKLEDPFEEMQGNTPIAINILVVFWIIEFQPSEHLVYVSPAFERIWGIPEQKLYENLRVWIESIEPNDQARVEGLFNAMIRGEQEFITKFKILRPDKQERWISVQSERILDENNELLRVVGVSKDITNETLVDIAKTEFISFASHQLKTPVTSLNWDLEMLMNGDYGKITKDQLQVLQKLYSTNMRMCELVDGFLNLSRIEMGTFTIESKQVDVVNVCEDVLVEMNPRINKKQHNIIKKYVNNSIKFLADPTLLRIIFQNLISNAIKYTHDKGKITITIDVHNSVLIISVANNGIPIVKEDQPKIFSKMFRASNAQNMDSDGTGLGLYLIKSIVESSGGTILFTSEEGAETEFIVTFPVSGMEKKDGTKELKT